MQKRTFIKSLAAVTALSAIVLLTGCDEEKAVAEKPFRVGVTAGPHAAIVTEAAKVAAKNGLKVEVVEFTDYVTPDTALNDGALDAAVYQHEPFLLNFNKQKGTKLANVGNAVVQPMGFYSNKVKSVADIPEGAVISVPNDPTNCGRGLLLLQAAGLIKLPEGMGSEASLADIVENKRNLKIRELEAAQLPRSLDDALVAVIPMNYVISAGLIKLPEGMGSEASLADIVENKRNLKIRELEAAQLPRSLDDALVAVIPMNYVISAGLSPQKQGFYFESLEAPFALIIIAAHQDRRNDKSVQDFVKYYRSPEVKAFVEKTFNGTIKPSW